MMFKMEEIKRVRESMIAGSWYPGSKRELESMLDKFLEKTEKRDLGRIRVLIAPHAGYLYSGQVAAFSFKQVEDADYKKVIIMGPSHRHPLSGLSIGNYTHYKTPLGEVKISPLAKEMIQKSDLINSIEDVHSMEHSVEIEIPFLQMVLRDFEIIPIVVGRLSEAQREEAADFLINYLDDSTLLVVSTDLSHYHPYDSAAKLDTDSIDAITSLDYGRAGECEMCGSEPVLIAIKIAQKMNLSAEPLKYENSGDITGDKSGVVGYAAIAFYQNKSGNPNSNGELSREEQKFLLDLARDTIELYVKEGKTLEVETDNPKLRKKRGAFVTLEKGGMLRGCIGHIRAVEPLYLSVRGNAISAATKDPRFPPVKADELDKIEIEVSVLSAPSLIKADSPDEYLEKIEAGRDGIIIEQGTGGATYLPQVWEQIPDKVSFLENLCQKAWLPKDCWKDDDTKIYRYGVQAFREEDIK